MYAAAIDNPSSKHAATPGAFAPRWLVEPFRSISLAELNAKADMLQRRDNKYVVSGRVLEQAMDELAQYFDILEIDGKRDFTYDTCYFDDAEHSSYFNHH
ncbi:MAG TPA: VTC domain-containing protein, partial [Oleiagrimonas sp.]|nr:VTC domain-containing protein [Oleiagrimonas sp.]